MNHKYELFNQNHAILNTQKVIIIEVPANERFG